MKTKDYYKILEINETATEAEIKAAYRTLARKFHPDIAGEENADKFKDINEAHDILMNRQKRYEYDAMRRLYTYATTPNPEPNKQNSTHQETKNSFNNFWTDFVKYQQAKTYNSAPQPKNGSDITTEVTLTIAEALNGTSKKINILHTKPCPHCEGRKFVNGSKCQSCNASGYVSEHKRLTVKIPASVKSGYKIRIVGEGNQGAYGGKNGNLYLLIKIENKSDFKYDGINITRTVPITPAEAVLGADIEIPTSNGLITMKVVPNTNSGQKFRLQGQGITKNGITGDLIVTVEIKIPDNITEAEKDLYRKLAKLSSQNIRKVF